MNVLEFGGLNFHTGWVCDPVEVSRIVKADGVPPVSTCLGFGQTPQRNIVDLTVYLKKVWGDEWYLNQGTCGSCVAFANALAADTLIAIDVVDNAAAKPDGRTDPQTIYWGSRVEVGGNRLWGQGSVGIWAAKWLKEYGVIPQRRYPSVDLSTYSANQCCGERARQGVPDDIEPIARQHPVKAYAQAESFEDVVRAIEAGYPVTVASNQGFSKQRDGQGFARPSGQWGHCMCIVGVRHDRPGALIANSWGAFYTGGPADMSPAVKWVERNTVEHMLRAGDSWVLSDLSGWPRKGLTFERLNW